MQYVGVKIKLFFPDEGILVIKTITAIGADGTMGYTVAGIFAAFGNAKVYMISRTLEKAEEAINKAAKSVKADSIKYNLIPADYSMLERVCQFGSYI